MKTKFFLQVVSLVTIGVTSLVLGTVGVDAASFEAMKEDVEVGKGVIYNPQSDNIMGNGASKEFIELIEEEIKSSNVEEVTPEMMDSAFEILENTSDIVKQPYDPSASLIQPRGANVPTQPKAIPANGYPSQPFSGAGWRYSGYIFVFNNYPANPWFGVSATKDSFNFHTQTNVNYYPRGKHVIPGNGQTLYFSTVDRGSYLNGYFSTYNPVNGSKYYIF